MVANEEPRFGPDIVYGGMGDSDALTMVEEPDGDWVCYEGLARARTQAIKDCIAALEEMARFGSSETVLAKEACCDRLHTLLDAKAKGVTQP